MFKRDAITPAQQEREEEIYSEYFRIKNRLMDYDENLDEAIANARMLLRLKTGTARLREHYAKAQKHVGLILWLGRRCGAIPSDADKDALKKITDVSQGIWKDIKDFEYCQKWFTDWYIMTKLYSVTKDKPKMLAPSDVG